MKHFKGRSLLTHVKTEVSIDQESANMNVSDDCFEIDSSSYLKVATASEEEELLLNCSDLIDLTEDDSNFELENEILNTSFESGEQNSDMIIDEQKVDSFDNNTLVQSVQTKIMIPDFLAIKTEDSNQLEYENNVDRVKGTNLDEFSDESNDSFALNLTDRVDTIIDSLSDDRIENESTVIRFAFNVGYAISNVPDKANVNNQYKNNILDINTLTGKVTDGSNNLLKRIVLENHEIGNKEKINPESTLPIFKDNLNANKPLAAVNSCSAKSEIHNKTDTISVENSESSYFSSYVNNRNNTSLDAGNEPQKSPSNDKSSNLSDVSASIPTDPIPPENKLPVIQVNSNLLTFEQTKIFPISEMLQRVPGSWTTGGNNMDGVAIQEIPLNSEKGIEIANLFNKSACNTMLTLKTIHRIENRYLWMSYQLKKDEIERLYKGKTEEMLLFHGTREVSVDSIYNNNFDWRYGGSNRGGHKFGMGVSFSPIATYASHYTDQFDDGEKQNKMILSRVLVSKVVLGKPHMVVPPTDFDTTRNHERKVIVKFDDFTYYPEYQISYTGKLFDHYAAKQKLKELEKLASKIRPTPIPQLNIHPQQFHSDDMFHNGNGQHFMMPPMPSIIQNMPPLLPPLVAAPPYFEPLQHVASPQHDLRPAFPEESIRQFQINNLIVPPQWQHPYPPAPHEYYNYQQQLQYNNYEQQNVYLHDVSRDTPYMRPVNTPKRVNKSTGKGRKRKRSQSLSKDPAPTQQHGLHRQWADKPLDNKFKHKKFRYDLF